jgi:hypothetical protein
VIIGISVLVVGTLGGVWFLLKRPTPLQAGGASSATSSKAQSAEKYQGPQIDPLSKADVESHMGEVVTVEGVISSSTDSQLFHARYLKFSGGDADSPVVSVPSALLNEPTARALINKRIRAFGTLSNAAGVNRLVVESPADIRVSH